MQDNNTEDNDNKYIPKGYITTETDRSGHMITTDTMSHTITFLSSQKKHCIEFEYNIDNNDALISRLDILYHSPQELALLLRAATDRLEGNNIETIYQQVSPEDWDNNLSKAGIFKLINKNDEHGFLNIGCSTKELPLAIMKGLGF